MKMVTKRTIVALAIFVVMFLMVFPSFAAANIPAPTSEFYVNDFAGIFSPEQKQELMNKAVSFAEQNDGVQIVVTTVKSLEGLDAEDYAYQMYNKYEIGKDDMGILILLATEDRKVRIEIGKAMEAYLTDSRAGSLIDKNALSYLKKDDFAQGIISLQNACIEYIKPKLDKEAASQQNLTTENADNEKSNFNWTAFLLGFFTVIAVSAFVFLFIRYNNKLKEAEEEKEDLSFKNDLIRRELEIKNDKLHDSLDRKSNEYSKLQAKQERVEEENKRLKDTLSRAEKLHPGLQQEISKMIADEKLEMDKKIASNVTSKISEILASNGESFSSSYISNVICTYNSLTLQQKSFVKGDYSALCSLCDKVKAREQDERDRNEAERISRSVTPVINKITRATWENFEQLTRLKRMCNNISVSVAGYVGQDVLDKLNMLYNQAKKDKERKEEEEREAEEERRRKKRREEEEEEERRRMNSYHTSSIGGFGSSGFGGGHSSGGGGFGGLGGHSGGGGAGRSF